MSYKEEAKEALAEFPDIENEDMDFNDAVCWLVSHAEAIKEGLSVLAKN